jgi:hypothetical protein
MACLLADAAVIGIGGGARFGAIDIVEPDDLFFVAVFNFEAVAIVAAVGHQSCAIESFKLSCLADERANKNQPRYKNLLQYNILFLFLLSSLIFAGWRLLGPIIWKQRYDELITALTFVSIAG